MNENELNERVDVDVFDEFNVELLCFRLKNNFYVFEKFQEKKNKQTEKNEYDDTGNKKITLKKKELKLKKIYLQINNRRS